MRVAETCPGGNPRTPTYVRGRVGTVVACHGRISNPLDHHDVYPPLYSVAFTVDELWGREGQDRVVADLHEEWLEPLSSHDGDDER